ERAVVNRLVGMVRRLKDRQDAAQLTFGGSHARVLAGRGVQARRQSKWLDTATRPSRPAADHLFIEQVCIELLMSTPLVGLEGDECHGLGRGKPLLRRC